MARDPGYTYIKVKLLSLAAEAKIIRTQERLARGKDKLQLRLGLAEHRRGIVRHEARHALLAYAFLRGVPYRKLEAKVRSGNEPDWPKLRKLVDKHGSNWIWLEKEDWNDYIKRHAQVMEEFDKWAAEGEA